jgi:uncharacterized surface protein with fasciclin (FAS1) repeats
MHAGTATLVAPVDIIELLSLDGHFTILTAALEAAELSETLRGDGPFTLFAPSDAAFKCLPKATLENLMKPVNVARLTAALTYHVVPEQLPSADFVGALLTPMTMHGSPLRIDGLRSVMINGARLVTPDLEATNGTVHVIDTVLLPSTRR